MLYYIYKTVNRVLFGLFICSIIFPKSGHSRNSKTADITINDQGQFDVNRIRSDMENNGMFVSHRISGHS